jgi:hypothetical protein
MNQDYSSVLGLGHINTTGFLFGDDDEKAAAKKESATSPDVKSYLQMNATDDKFPILVRREDYPGLVSDVTYHSSSPLTVTCSSLHLLLRWIWRFLNRQVRSHRAMIGPRLLPVTALRNTACPRISSTGSQIAS